HILIEKGVKPDTIVGIMIDRSPQAIIGILGILKSGGAYLPIEPDYPQDRIDYMLKDSGAKILVTTPGLPGKFENLSIVNCQDEITGYEQSNSPLERGASSTSFTKFGGGGVCLNLQTAANPANLAYIIYTSGSTGKPKGVMVEHASVINVLFALHQQYPFHESSVYLLKTSFAFDVSVTELFGWFLGKGKLAILEKDGEKDPEKILDTIWIARITHINFVPSMFNVFTDSLNPGNIAKLSHLQFIFLAGEVLLPQSVNKFKALNSNVILENLYGPTEAAVYASKYSLSDWAGTGTIPIGSPLQNMKLYILDKNDNLQPMGVPGELCIAGTGVARGYLNQPELTAEKFDQDEQQNVPGSRFYWSYMSYSSYIYKTGDFARWLPDGNIEFRGRIDQQVKIRGFRIELGEIENHLLNHNHIKEAVVTAQANPAGDMALHAYIVPAKEFDTAGLREYLSGKLPEYMIPAYFIQLDRIPLTTSGKINRKALPEPVVKPGENYVPPA
ncbi:MAG: amino acid adenylation domain-containing protein, partial [Candidatus Aminicenantes bacterium]